MAGQAFDPHAGPGVGVWMGTLEGLTGKTVEITFSRQPDNSTNPVQLTTRLGDTVTPGRVEFFDTPQRHYAFIAWNGRNYAQGGFVLAWRQNGESIEIADPQGKLDLARPDKAKRVTQAKLIQELDVMNQSDFTPIATLKKIH